MRVTGPEVIRTKVGYKPLLRAEIEEAQRNSLSNKGAARFLGVDYKKYKKYADLYGLFEQHLNPTGKGITRGAPGRNGISLTRIFSNEFPDYNLHRLKNRMVARRMLVEKCAMCGFDERRVSDKKIPILLTFKNGKKDYSKDNLVLMCYNCCFLVSGAVERLHRKSSLTKFNAEEEAPEDSQNIEIEPTDPWDIPANIQNVDLKELQKEALDELDA